MKYLEQFHSLEIMIKFWDVCHKFWQKVILFWKACDQIFSSFFCDRFCYIMMIKLSRMLHSLTFSASLSIWKLLFSNVEPAPQQCCQSLTFSASLLTKDSCWLKLLRRSLETFNTFLKFSIKGGHCLFTGLFLRNTGLDRVRCPSGSFFWWPGRFPRVSLKSDQN